MSAEPAAVERKRLTQAELDAICARHDRLWQAKPGGARAVFAWMDLTGLDLRGRNLTDADFSAACMIGCDLSRAKLDNAAFFGADMQDIILVEASLRRADLRGACLRGADLSGADLFEADLREGAIAAADRKIGFRLVEAQNRDATEARGASLVGANLERSKLTGVIAQAADFTDAVMRDCKLVRANLKQASFRGADLAGADLSGADLSGADLRDAVLVGVKAAMWRTDGARMEGALTDDRPAGSPVERMPAAEMLREHALWCETGGAKGQPSVFDKVDLRPLKSITGLNLTALSAKGAVFYGLDMQGVQLQGAQLQGADLRSANLRRADLRGARLTGARLNGADLREAQLGPLMLGPDRLLPADLSDACLRAADLSGADLRRASFRGADLARTLLHGAQTKLTDLSGANLTAIKGLDAQGGWVREATQG
ncbi:MAG: pentapeptide repeat-containing protein [Brevundimonas sp.]|uniref:pentapeptide repeat-containing protein n=1 Tax=Brevundimonas sp. TaxID=1871086 RepID=UPI001205ACA9|nr:pentapeptide repeat-containing protein [Brevundimonas sp.]RZJ19195.1 MAG: pentapeptide repeat-containing protein [Brevundimonas sp.]